MKRAKWPVSALQNDLVSKCFLFMVMIRNLEMLNLHMEEERTEEGGLWGRQCPILWHSFMHTMVHKTWGLCT